MVEEIEKEKEDIRNSSRICGNPDCCTSTGIHGGLTFGSGELDGLGFWDKPCILCANEFEKHRLDDRALMKTTLMTIKKMSEEEAERNLKISVEYLDVPAWPQVHI